MIEPAIPRDEAERLAALRALGLLDSAPEKAFDDIVALTRVMLGVPIALVSLIDAERQWFKAAAGLAARQTPRSVSFCAHAIHQDDVFVVPDASVDPRFHDNPLVEGAPDIRFYAGVPLRLPSGHRIGTLCALSSDPREEFDAAAREKLRLLGGLVLDEIELRTARAELDRLRAVIGRHTGLIQSLELPVAFADADGRIESCNAPFALLCAGGDPVGRPAGEALGIPANVWSPSAMAASGASVQRVAVPALAIYRSADGLALVGEPGSG